MKQITYDTYQQDDWHLTEISEWPSFYEHKITYILQTPDDRELTFLTKEDAFAHVEKYQNSPFVCSECFEPTEGIYEDQGNGPYEFWGAKGNDTDIQYVSTCCSADVLETLTGPVLTCAPGHEFGPDKPPRD